ncbi:GntR family transcriptional regulator [Kordiimonas sp. SCSIO 12610]|uniref:GntR family transcriptional regulator n=1 Tax=Kordiimonas sp. SCSIO 12610 TaxID=2829597 RepID=UPI00210A08D7|nr:GntR family transcriptional regulator [Kordiimonas sp. SCSIO 12610]UTW56113.1 GntR family transcriptional regulator [Kordiimonas sp. SCSIO 12610]
MTIDFSLSQADSRPMYEQITIRIKERIAVGDWPAGMKLPSIRELAVALKVSVITVKRAYQDLEAEGVINVQHGKGCFVADRADGQGAHLIEELDRILLAAIKIADVLSMPLPELEEKLRKLHTGIEGKAS